ncbi:hypothetical protein ACHAQA_003694 [Verticillium albo-atrum]
MSFSKMTRMSAATTCLLLVGMAVPSTGIEARIPVTDKSGVNGDAWGASAFAATYARWSKQVPEPLRKYVKLSEDPATLNADSILDIFFVSELKVGSSREAVNLILDSDRPTPSWIKAGDNQGNAVAYHPEKSETAIEIEDSEFRIHYADGDFAWGSVWLDTLELSPTLIVPNTSIGAATYMSERLRADSVTTGLMGISKAIEATTRPPTPTIIDTLKLHLPADQRFIGADLRANSSSGQYTFGALPTKLYTNDISWAAPVPDSGHWDFPVSRFRLDPTMDPGIWIKRPFVATADTGTTLLMLPRNIVDVYYSSITSARKADEYGGAWVFPCAETAPDFGFAVGASGDEKGYEGIVPGAYIRYAPASAEDPTTCFGGVQDVELMMEGVDEKPDAIFGDIALKSLFVAFDIEGGRVGFADKELETFDLSAKVAALCYQYSKEVASARADIQRLRTQVEQLGNALRAIQRLVEGTKCQSLLSSRELVGSFGDCIADLERLERKLKPNSEPTLMRRAGLRALKWPFSSKEVGQILSSLERHEKTILLGLQTDQTIILLNIQEAVKQLGLQPSEDASISSKPHLMVPFPPNPSFVHRLAIEERMQKQYSEPGQRMALVGIGGFGKSQLAIEFAHHVHADKPGTSVFWVHGNSRATFEESYRALADILELPRRHESEVDVLALVRDWLQRDDVSPWLMILDNADDMGVFFPDEGHNHTLREPLASYLPKSINGKILVTSRSLDAAEKLAGNSQAILRIPVMGKDEALELLRKRLEGEPDEAAAIQLAHALDYIPLAINQAAAYINRRSPRVTITSYLDDFRKSEKRKDSLLRSDKGDLGRHDAVSNSVVVTWQVTFEQIRRERPSAANLLSLLSQFQAQNIPESMLHGYNDVGITSSDEGEVDFENAWIESDEESVSEEFEYAWIESDKERKLEAFENDMDVLRGYSLLTLPNLGLCEMHPLVQFYWAELLTNVGWYMLNIGEYSRAEAMGEEAAQARKDVLGPGHPSTLNSTALLASTFWSQGQWEAAEKLDVEVMERTSTYISQGRLEAAEKLFVEVIESRKTYLGANHPRTVTAMNNLASTYIEQGRMEAAEKLYLEAMATCKKNLGAGHPDSLTAMNNLAATYSRQDRMEAAEKLYLEVVATSKKSLGADHPHTLAAMSNLATMFWNQGRMEAAENLGVEVTESSITNIRVNHPDTPTTMDSLAHN